MQHKEIRYRIPYDLDKRFSMICLANDLKKSKQMHELVRKFVEVHEQNIENLKDK